MISIDQMRQVRQALNDAGLDTPFTGRVKRGFSIKLSCGMSDIPEMDEYMDSLVVEATEATKQFDNIEIKRTRALGTGYGSGLIQLNVVVRVVTPKA